MFLTKSNELDGFSQVLTGGKRVQAKDIAKRSKTLCFFREAEFQRRFMRLDLKL